jgi:hypothetical protein
LVVVAVVDKVTAHTTLQVVEVADKLFADMLIFRELQLVKRSLLQLVQVVQHNLVMVEQMVVTEQTQHLVVY